MTEPAYGIIINESYAGPLPVQSGDFSVIGLLLPADDADAATFPLNTPVQFNSSDSTYLGKAGTGDFAKALTAINNQLAAWQSAASVVAVLVARGVDRPTTIANLVGSSVALTGLYAFLKAGALTMTIPRLIGSPGYTGDVGLGVTAPTVSAAGIGFTAAPAVAFSPAGATAHAVLAVANGIDDPVVTAGGSDYTHAAVVFTPAGATAHAVLTAGAVSSVIMDLPGAYEEGVMPTAAITGDGAGATMSFSLFQNSSVGSIVMDSPGAYGAGVDVTATISGGGGSGATMGFTMAPVSNPLCAALPAVLKSLLAKAIVGSSGDGVVADTFTWRQTLSSDRLDPADAWVIPGSGVGYTDGVAEALGAQVAVDFQHAGIPGWSISGQQINGIGGLKTYYSFSLTDGAMQGQELLAQQVSVIEPGAIGSDTAIASSGYVWAGVWNASTDPRAWFSNKRRMKDYVNLALVKAIRLRLGVDNVTPHAVQAVLNDMVVLGSWLLSKQISIGFKVSFVPSQNSPSQLQQGQFVVSFANEVPAPITQVTVNSSDDPDALTVELATIIAQANTIAPQYLTS
jgi:hypothetical protein